MEMQSFFEKLNNRIKNSITIKLIVIGILFLIMLIPITMVQDLIRERENRSKKAIREVSSKWGNEQTVSGPILTIPYKSYYNVNENKEKKIITVIKYAHFLPDNLNITGKILPEVRYRGIFEVVVYKSTMTLSGKFFAPDFSEWEIEEKDILWKEAFISIGIPDMRGIKDYINMKWNNETLSFNPGIDSKDIISSGVSARYLIHDKKMNYDFLLNIKLNGSQKLFFTPLGKETKVKLSSNWTTPCFDGAYLPDERKITKKDFNAEWKILHLNRNYPQKWLNNLYEINSSEFGVKLLMPVEQYQKSMRSAKYASMFISLTFLIFFFVEVLNRRKIHPIQYILVGLALCIFFTLLLSISEHISFYLSYILSSICIVIVITGYTKSIFKNNKLTFVMSGILIILYAFIYIILQLEDYALLLGSIGLLVIISTVMYLSRKINWYDLE